MDRTDWSDFEFYFREHGFGGGDVAYLFRWLACHPPETESCVRSMTLGMACGAVVSCSAADERIKRGALLYWNSLRPTWSSHELSECLDRAASLKAAPGQA